MKSEQAEIIERARSGDLEAFQQLHEEYGRRILNFVYRMVESREDAEDLTQNVFLKAFAEIWKLQEPGRFESWLYRIARNEVYQSYRRRRSEPDRAETTEREEDADRLPSRLADPRPTPQEEVLHEELGQAIRQALGNLSPKLREVFVLAVVEQKSYADIAEIVGRSVLSVKTDVFRARTHARKALGKYLESGK